MDHLREAEACSYSHKPDTLWLPCLCSIIDGTMGFIIEASIRQLLLVTWASKLQSYYHAVPSNFSTDEIRNIPLRSSLVSLGTSLLPRCRGPGAQ